jgi:inner membrane protein
MLPLWSVLLAWLCTLIWRRGPSWRAYVGVFAWGLGIHIAGDWITSFGTMIWAPVSDARLGIGTTFIIDLWVTGIILIALAACLLLRHSILPAVAGMLVLCGYVSFQFVLQQRAVEFGVEYARAAGIEDAVVTALPRPVSPFNWMVIVEERDRYRYAFVNLVRRETTPAAPGAGIIQKLDAPYQPRGQATWFKLDRFGADPRDVVRSQEAWTRPEMAFFRWFAEYPVLYKVETGNPETCVWFQDLRFLTPGRDAWPFRYGVCREVEGPWRAFELGGDGRAEVY